MTRLVAWWVRFYTRDLPDSVAGRRVEEIDADLHDQIAHDRAAGLGDRRIAAAVASRMLRGLLADAAWRRGQARTGFRPTTLEVMAKMRKTLYRPALRIVLGVAVLLSLPLAGVLLGDGVAWSVVDFVFAGVFLAVIGVAIELATRRAGNLAVAIGLAALGVGAAVFGEADDAPGLVLIGIVLFASAFAMGVRRVRHSG